MGVVRMEASFNGLLVYLFIYLFIYFVSGEKIFNDWTD